MDFTNLSPDAMQGMLFGGALGGLFATALILGILVAIALYIFIALSWQKIAMRQGYRYSWFAWIPILNLAMILELGGFHWAWIFILLIPILGWIAIFVLSIIAIWRIFEKENYHGWFSLAPIIPKVGWILFLIALGFVAWKPKQVVKKSAKKKK